LTGGWNVSKALKLRAGVLKLLDTEPPFSNQACYALAGDHATHTDRRGRSHCVDLSCSFK
jgi:iron complex outermembrane receptor protein